MKSEIRQKQTSPSVGSEGSKSCPWFYFCPSTVVSRLLVPPSTKNISPLTNRKSKSTSSVSVRSSSPVSWRSKEAPGAPSEPPPVSVDTTGTGERSPPSAPPPLCRVSAGSCAVQGWRRRPTDEKQKRSLVYNETKKVQFLCYVCFLL